MMNSKRSWIFGMALAFYYHVASAAVSTSMYMLDEGYCGRYLGWVRFDDTIYGLLITPHLHGLPPGIHGWQIYECGSCANNGDAAGEHFDPMDTEEHQGPFKGGGHLGDLPVLIVDAKGRATLPVVAPRLKLADIRGRALVVHRGGDNYSDGPKFDGGGGEKLSCGTIPEY